MNRRRLLGAVVSSIGGLAAYAASIPFVKSFLPSAKARALGGPVEVDLSAIEPGAVKAYEYRGRVMLVLRRTQEMIERASAMADRLGEPDLSADPFYVHGPLRSTRPEFLVVEGVCTHLSCVPQLKSATEGRREMGDWWQGGFICPCHRSAYDYAGRVVQGPAPRNLAIPPYHFVSESRIVIGETPEQS